MALTAEQIERWHTRTCARCGRRGWFAANWPDGYVCRTCHDRAVQRRGHCPECGTDRALPGQRAGDQAPICADCAGFTTSLACSRCGYEDKLHARRLCTRCTLADKLDELLDDGTGRTRPDLAPLRESLLSADRPLSVLTWLYVLRSAGSGLI
jgi:RecJ-like exonuclease